jgi:hypothetical protein
MNHVPKKEMSWLYMVFKGLNPLSRFPAAFSERRGKSFVRKQPAEKITKVVAPRSENAA